MFVAIVYNCACILVDENSMDFWNIEQKQKKDYVHISTIDFHISSLIPASDTLNQILPDVCGSE